jgi:hypothetical protein
MLSRIDCDEALRPVMRRLRDTGDPLNEQEVKTLRKFFILKTIFENDFFFPPIFFFNIILILHHFSSTSRFIQCFSNDFYRQPAGALPGA